MGAFTTFSTFEYETVSMSGAQSPRVTRRSGSRRVSLGVLDGSVVRAAITVELVGASPPGRSVEFVDGALLHT